MKWDQQRGILMKTIVSALVGKELYYDWLARGSRLKLVAMDEEVVQISLH